MEGGNKTDILEKKISKKILAVPDSPSPQFKKFLIQHSPERGRTVNLYLLLRGRYQRLHLVPHYILINNSLLDKFDTQARCVTFSSLPTTASSSIPPLLDRFYPHSVPLLTRAPPPHHTSLPHSHTFPLF